ncbi:HYC_CC_PP family protein [Phaeocystidibacter luteus]|uniref:Uncharacterized protein n=1 Tax=Phaeocystidibacter luteus TaxID=911197 RepID=A0A6N6RLS6_9FLAO|nr:hypothetical protein [Phaeocystidibacter luteus]KAB2814513.1 hypothetical protein F8C67_01885 [Phaeocystidibacter luteus]
MKILRQILALLLATTMLTSASPATWNGHYCGGELMESSFSEKFTPCCPVDLHTSNELQLKRNSCDFEMKSFNGYDHSTTPQNSDLQPVAIATWESLPFDLHVENHPDYFIPRSNAPPLTGRQICERYDRWLL